MARSDDKWVCWYGCHVTEGAYKMAWIFTIVNILGALIIVLSFISNGLNAKIIFYAVNGLVSVLSWLLISFGHICGIRSHRMYLPFLFLFAISTVYVFFEILYFVLQRILMFKSPDSIYVMFGLSLKEYERLVGRGHGYADIRGYIRIRADNGYGFLDRHGYGRMTDMKNPLIRIYPLYIRGYGILAGHGYGRITDYEILRTDGYGYETSYPCPRLHITQ
uniref:YkuD domain-containing protein n=1 Tax=Globodera pallida TaxID=36090 RepID=A0A183BM28_GLOPA